MLWRYQKEVDLKSFNKNYIDVLVKNRDGDEFRLTGLYGEPNMRKREETWYPIRVLANNNTISRRLIGNMNNVLSQSDK